MVIFVIQFCFYQNKGPTNRVSNEIKLEQIQWHTIANPHALEKVL